MSCGNASRSEKKRVVGDDGVNDIIQSNITGIAAGGTRRKLLDRESSEVSIEVSLSFSYEYDYFYPISNSINPINLYQGFMSHLFSF